MGRVNDITWVKPSPAAVEALAAAAPPAAGELVHALRTVGYPASKSAMTPKQEAILLLQVGAEIEHALIAQYLYTAYSLETDPARFRGQDVPAIADELVNGPLDGSRYGWQSALIRIAREEMGHLMTVQNLLRLIGGAIHLERDNYPMHTGLYPFPLVIEPLSRRSLAKYVTAEMPLIDHPSHELEDVMRLAEVAVGLPVNHVGVLYARIYHLFSKDETPQGPWRASFGDVFPNRHLADTDFEPVDKIEPYLAGPDEWRAGGVADGGVFVAPVKSRRDALEAIHAVAVQGEGLEDGQNSHFQRFLAIYRELVMHAGPTKWIPARDVPTNPTTDPHAPQDQTWTSKQARSDPDRNDPITDEIARPEAQLFDVRYQMLLMDIAHALYLRTTESGEADLRDKLVGWAFAEMLGGVGPLARDLTLRRRLASPDGGAAHAGAPFVLPSPPFLPEHLISGHAPSTPLTPAEGEMLRIRHRQLLDQSSQLIAELRQKLPEGDPARGILDGLSQIDVEMTRKFPP